MAGVMRTIVLISEVKLLDYYRSGSSYNSKYRTALSRDRTRVTCEG